MNSSYEGIKDLKPRFQAVYVPVGTHTYEIMSVQSKPISPKKGKGDNFIIELKTVETNGDIPLGTIVSRVISVIPHGEDWKYEKALQEIQAFIAAAMECSPEEVGLPEILETCGPENPLKGTKVLCIGSKKKPDAKFVNCVWN